MCNGARHEQWETGDAYLKAFTFKDNNSVAAKPLADLGL